MGRAKIAIKYREDSRARRTTYLTRMKGLRKKAGELSLLCGVDILVASLSPELNSTLDFSPAKDTSEFYRIRERYLCFRKMKSGNGGNVNSEQKMTCLPMPSPSFSFLSFHEEMAAMEIKLEEVRERLHYLQGSSQRQCQEVEERHQAPVSMPLQEDFHLPEQSASVVQSLHSYIADFSTPLPISVLPSDSPLQSHLDDLYWCDSLLQDYENGL